MAGVAAISSTIARTWEILPGLGDCASDAVFLPRRLSRPVSESSQLSGRRAKRPAVSVISTTPGFVAVVLQVRHGHDVQAQVPDRASMGVGAVSGRHHVSLPGSADAAQQLA